MTEQDLETLMLKNLFVILGGREANVEAAKRCAKIAIDYADTKVKEFSSKQDVLSSENSWFCQQANSGVGRCKQQCHECIIRQRHP